MTDTNRKITKNILVTPLNWGLGHAARCIPIIQVLQTHGYTPIIASDGQALLMLKKEFPNLLMLELPSYNIKYPQNGKYFKWALLKNFPRMIKTIGQEKKLVKKWVEEYSLCGIISDNRPGVISRKVPSVYITHQLNVLSGSTSWLSGKVHRFIIKKFDACWVPDLSGFVNLSGKLGHLNFEQKNLKYIGPMSRMQKKTIPQKYDLMVLLSGPEPQRSLLEEILRREIREFKGNVVFVKGVVENEQIKTQENHITFYNFMTSIGLEKVLNESAVVLCRSGYTSIMDLAALEKKAFFIPTPGQYEQEYLAKKLKKNAFAPYAKQARFRISDLQQMDLYKGLPDLNQKNDWENLFGLFERKRKF